MIYTVINKRIKGGPLEISYDVIQELSFQLDVSGTGGLYIACGLDLQHNPNELLFYSDSCSYSDGVLTFTVNTYTENFLNRVTNFSTKAWLEIGRMLEGNKSVLLFDDIIVQPRVYLEGEPPEPVPSSQYATMLWVQSNFQPIITEEAKLNVNLVDGAISEEWAEDNLQPIITSSAQLSYDLLSGTPLIGNGKLAIYQGTELKGEFYANSSGTITIDLDAGGGGGGVTSGWVEENFEPLITETRKLDASLISGLTPGGVTSSYVVEKISEHNLAIDAHSSLFNSKQDIITASSMLDASYLSGEIPSSMLPVRDVQVRNTSNQWLTCVTDGIAQLPLASSTRTGVVAAHFNLGFDMNGTYLKIHKASNNDITNRGTSTASNQPYENCPIVPNNLNFAISAAFTDAKKVQWKSKELSGLQDAIGISNPGSGIITLTQGGAVKGSFNVNQSNNQTINLDAGGGGGGSMMYSQIYSSDIVLTAFHDCSYFWALQDQDATLYAEQLLNVAYDIPIDINLSGSTVTLSGITRSGTFVDGFLNHCLITKRYDKTYLYIYAYDEGLPMETGWQGEWTTLGQDAQTFSAAAGIYEATGGGRYTIVGGAGYYIELAGTNWRLFNASGNEVAMGPSMDEPMEGDYGTVQNPPGVGDSVLTIKLVNIIIPE